MLLSAWCKNFYQQDKALVETESKHHGDDVVGKTLSAALKGLTELLTHR